MSPATAVTLLLATCSLALSAPKRSVQALQASSALALAVLAVGVGALGIYATGMEPPEARWLQLPAPQTTTCFVLIGVLFLFAGYVFRVDAFVGISPSNVTSPQTLLCIALLAFVISARRAQEGSILAMLIGSGIGSHITRVVLPAIIVMPFAVFGLIAYLERAHLSGKLRTRDSGTS